jgi:aminoglycoside phosphotransferase (APT) family kinase protein
MSASLRESLLDPRLPNLRAVLDPYELGQVLRKVMPPELEPVGEIRVKVLQHHRASRCTVDIVLETLTGKREIVGKVYATDRSDVYRTMQQISRAGFGPEAEFSIPQPLAFVPELNLLLQEKVAGPLATEVFLKGSEAERALAAERCASWLAHFHTHAPTSGPAFYITPELSRYWVRRLAKRAGSQAQELSGKAALLCQRLENAGAKLNGAERGACHGTYCHYQIILNEARTVTLDWDGFCVAHPSLDLARFIVVLQQLALKTQGSLKAFDAVVEVFCKTYADKRKFGVAEHLPFYKAAHCMKHAKHHLKPGNGGVEMAETMLDEGLRILAEEM